MNDEQLSSVVSAVVMKPVGYGVACLLVGCLGSAVAVAHEGMAQEPGFFTPGGIVELGASDEPGAPLMLTLTWADDDEPDGVHRFGVQSVNGPPMHRGVDLEEPPSYRYETQINDPANQAELDLSDLPSGTYWAYAESQQEEVCDHVEFAPALIVRRQEGELAPTGVLITEPSQENLVGDEDLVLVIEAVSPSQPSLTLRAGLIDVIEGTEPAPESGCALPLQEWVQAHVVVEKLSMTADPAAGPDRWRAELSWDTQEVDNGFYAFRAQIESAEGQQAESWSFGYGVVLHRGQPAPSAPVDSLDSAPDTVPVIYVEATPESGCSAGNPASRLLVSVLLMFGLWVPLMRRQRE